MRRIRFVSALLLRSLLIALCLAAGASAATIGWLSNSPGPSSGDPLWVDPSASITAAGHTPVELTDLGAASIGSVDVLWYFNVNNTAHQTALVDATADIESFVASGGVFLLGDWSSGQENRNWLGLDATTFAFLPTSQDLTVLDPGHPAVTGIGGTVDDTSLDSLSSSSHGYALLGTLPTGSVAVLRQAENASYITDFHYGFGAGTVYYSTQPLPLRSERTAYVTNLAQFTGALVVPEPGTAGLLALGLGLLGARRRRQARMQDGLAT